MIDTIPTEYELDRDGHYIRVISAKNVNSPGYSYSILVRVGLDSQKVTYRTVTVDAKDIAVWLYDIGVPANIYQEVGSAFRSAFRMAMT